MWLTVLGGMIVCELLSNTLYQGVVSVTKKKKYYASSVDNEWNELYILDKLTQEELIGWIQETICYNKKHPDPLRHFVHPDYREIPRGNVLKWVSYMLYFQSLWQLDSNRLVRAEKLLRLAKRLVSGLHRPMPPLGSGMSWQPGRRHPMFGSMPQCPAPPMQVAPHLCWGI